MYAKKGGIALQVDPRGKTWNRLRASIGQPNFVEEDKVAAPRQHAMA